MQVSFRFLLLDSSDPCNDFVEVLSTLESFPLAIFFLLILKSVCVLVA